MAIDYDDLMDALKACCKSGEDASIEAVATRLGLGGQDLRNRFNETSKKHAWRFDFVIAVLHQVDDPAPFLDMMCGMFGLRCTTKPTAAAATPMTGVIAAMASLTDVANTVNAALSDARSPMVIDNVEAPVILTKLAEVHRQVTTIQNAVLAQQSARVVTLSSVDS